MNEKSIVFLPEAAGLPAPWRKLSAQGDEVGRGAFTAEMSGPVMGEWIAIAPAGDVAVCWLDLPKGNAAQQLAVARWQMCERLGHDLADDDVVLGPVCVSGATPVAVVRRSLLAAWRSWMDGAGLKVTALVPAQLCAPRADNIVHLVQMPSDEVIVSTRDLSTIVTRDWVDSLTDGRPVQWTAADQALDRLALGATGPVLDLLSSAKGGGKAVGWKWLAGLALILCLGPVWTGLAHVAHDRWIQGRTDRAARAQLAAFMPDAEERLSVHPPMGSYARTIAALATVIAPRTGTTLSEAVGGQGEVRGVLSLGSLEDAALIRDEMTRYGLDFSGCDPVTENGQTVCAFVIGAIK